VWWPEHLIERVTRNTATQQKDDFSVERTYFK